MFNPEVQWRLLRPRIEGAFAGQTATTLAFLQEREGKVDPEQIGRWPLEGTIGEPSGSRLFDLLAQVAGAQQVYFYYGTAASFLCLKDMLFRAPMTAYRAVQELADREVAPPTPDGVRVPGPELVWPEDRSWVVATDCDLVSTYIACDERLAALLIGDPILEVLPVTLATRIDFDADSING